jgi:tetratricopeptide (TPR) repeat protein
MLSVISLLRRGSLRDTLQAALTPPLDDAKRLAAALVFRVQEDFPALRELCADALAHDPNTATGWHLRLLGSRAISHLSNDPGAQLAAIAAMRAVGDGALEALALEYESDVLAHRETWYVPLPFEPTWERVRELSARAAAAYEAMGDRDAALHVMTLLAIYSQGTGDRPRLLEFCERRAAELEAAGDGFGRAYCLTVAARIRVQENDAAQEATGRKAVAANKAAAAPLLTAALLLELGRHPQPGDPPQPYLTEAARLFAREDHWRGLHDAQFNLGRAEEFVGRDVNAVLAFETAVRAADRMGVPPMRMVARMYLAVLLFRLGHTGRALAYLEDGSTATRLGPWPARLLLQLGALATTVHDTERALRSFKRVVEMVEGADRPGELVRAWNGIGYAYADRGDEETFLEAIEAFTRAAEVRPNVASYEGIAITCARLGRWCAWKDRPHPQGLRERADAAIARGLGVATLESQRLSLHLAASWVEYHLGTRHAAIARIDEAIDAAASLPASKRLGLYVASVMQRVEYGAMRGDAAMLERADADADAMLDAILKADAPDLALAGGAFHDSAWVNAFLSVFGRTDEARREASLKARHRIRRSLELYEQVNARLRSGTPAAALALQLGEHRSAAIPYELAIRLFAMNGNPLDAFEALERLKSTVLASALASVRLAPPPGVSAELLEKEQRLLDIASSDRDPRERAMANAALSRVWDEIARAPGGERYARLRRGTTVDWRETSLLMHDVERELGDGRRFAIIEYALLTPSPLSETTVMAFCLHTRPGQLGPQIVPLNIGIRDIEAAAAALQPDGIHTVEASSILSSLAELLEPVRTFTSPGDLLCIVPSRALFGIPVHAIPIDGEPLLARNPVFYAPSVTLFAAARQLRRPHTRTTTVLGNPTEDLDGAEEEATKIAEVLGATRHLRGEATGAAFLEALRTRDVVHYAGHAAFDHEQPLQSGLVLHDGVLTAEQLFHAGEASAVLVVLSGCETGLNQVENGDEIVGLTRAFLYAGVPALITSLWRVYDDATLRLMTRFYDCWLNQSMPRVDALRTAALDVRKNNPDSVAAWAPFILLGDWR